VADSPVILEITDETGDVRQLEITGQRFVVGRLPEVDVPLPAEGVSRQHAEFVRDPAGRWWMRDLGSRNGTRVNGQRLAEAPLRGGERVRIGPYSLRFLGGESEQASPLTTIVGHVSLTSDEAGPLRSLAEMPAPQVQAVHLSRLVQFGHELSEVEDSESRLRMLCDLMVGGGFPGICAVAVRVQREQGAAGGIQPQMLLPPVYSARAQVLTMPYLSSRLLSAVALRMAPVMASNVGGQEVDVQVSIAANVQAHWAIACPIGVADQSIDVLYTTLTPAGTTGEWLAIVGLAAEQYQQSESIWSQRKVAAEHAVLQQELEQARKVQEQLVPRNLSIPGLDVAVQFHPCRWVGGDYVDVIPISGDRVVLVVADVCGHGMQAALLASTLHAVLNVLVPAGTELGAALAHLNDYLCRTLQPGRFATALCVDLDIKTGKCRALSAGHPAPVMISPNGKWRNLKCGEYVPLGVEGGPGEASQVFAMADDILPPGHVLAFYTDGLFEVAGQDGEQLGCEGLANKLTEIAQGHSDSATIAERFIQFVETFHGAGMAADDQSLLVVRRT
jgi:sigma-B regulation protein RsbU (phosphoserine phosphatase)